MKRMLFGVAILLVIGLIVGLGSFTVYKTDKKMNAIFEKIESHANNNQIKATIRLCDMAEKEWIKNEKTLSLFVNHQEVCDIGVSISALAPLIKHNEKAEFFSELNKAKTQLTHLSNMENIINK